MTFDIREHLDQLEPNPREPGKFFCPACGGHNLSVNLQTGAYNCWADDTEAHRALIRENLSPSHLVNTRPNPGRRKWNYCTVDGDVAATVERVDYGDGREKQVRRHHQPDLFPAVTPLYWEECISQFTNEGGRVFIAEGEDCCDMMRSIGLNAITLIGGSTGYKKDLYYDLLFQVRDALVLVPDMDKPGVKLMDAIAQDFPEALWCYVQGPNFYYWASERLPEKGGYDIADAIRNGADQVRVVSWIHRRQAFALTGQALEVDVEVNDMLAGLQKVYVETLDLAVRELKVAQYLKTSGLKDLGWTIQRAMKHCACEQFQQGVIEVVDSHDLLAAPTKRPRWIIPGFLPAASVVLLGASGGTGKAQPLDAKVLTPSGWKLMGQIQVGDEVIAADGTPTKVLGVFPQGEKQIYRVTFHDGSSTECCDEHLWLTRNYNGQSSVKPLSEIRDTLRYGKRMNRNHFVQMVEPVQFSQKDISVDPWVLGALIGDGTLYEGTPRFSNPEPAIALEMQHRLVPLGSLALVGSTAERCPSYSVIGEHCKKNAVLDALRSYGLTGKRSWEKFIPADYLFNTVEVRLAVLQGLMDTDGSFDGSCSLTTSSEQLSRDVVFLVQSLGGIATVASRIPSFTYKGEKKSGRRAYRVTFKLPPQFCPFLASLSKRKAFKAPTKYLPQRAIESIESAGIKLAQCIYIDHPSHLYVTDDFVVTHNTTLTYQLAKHIAIGVPWSEFPTVQGKVLIISTDESSHDTKEKLQTIDYASVPRGGVNFIRFWRFNQVSLLEEKIRQIEPTLVIIDSLTSTTAGLGMDRISSSAGDCLYELRDMAERYECSFIVLHHLNKNDEFRDSTTYVDNVSEAWKLSKDEKNGDFILDYAKSRSGFQGQAVLRRRLENYQWTVVGRLHSACDWDVEQRVCRWINENLKVDGVEHWLTANEIAARAIGLTTSEINSALPILRLTGRIACDTSIMAGRTVRKFAAWDAKPFASESSNVVPLRPAEMEPIDEYDDLLIQTRHAFTTGLPAAQMLQMLETYPWRQGGRELFWNQLDSELQSWLRAC